MKKIILLFPVLLLISCEFNKSYHVKYEVTGTAENVIIRYLNEYEESCSDSGDILPWTYSFDSHSGESVSVSASFADTEYKEVFITIYANNRVLEKAWAEGTEGGVAAASARLKKHKIF